MNVQIEVENDALRDALQQVAVVTPRAITKNGDRAYLVTVKQNELGQNSCFIYSQDDFRSARASLEVATANGTGSFLLPASVVDALRFATGQARIYATVGETFTLTAECADARAEMGSMDPRLVFALDGDFDAATDEKRFPAAILKQALRLATSFLPPKSDARIEDRLRTINIIDGSVHPSGDGYLYASTGSQAFYFECDAFKGKKLAIHQDHVATLLRFLETATGEIVVRTSPRMTYANDSRGRVLGWAHHKAKLKAFPDCPTSLDQHVMLVPRDLFLHSLEYVSALLPRGFVKIRIVVQGGAPGQMRVVASADSVRVKSVAFPAYSPTSGPVSDVTCAMNIKHAINLVAGVDTPDVELRIAYGAPGATNAPAFIRTVCEAWVDESGAVVAGSGVVSERAPKDAMRVRVTRLTASMA